MDDLCFVFACSILRVIWKLLQTKIRKKKMMKMMSLIPQGKARGKGNQQVCGVGKWIWKALEAFVPFAHFTLFWLLFI